MLTAVASLLALSSLSLLPGYARGQEGAPSPSDAERPELPSLIHVPYLSQTEALCGGAAAAMVLRYWGERAVRAEDFAELVDWNQEGIETQNLIETIEDRGWDAIAFRGSRELARNHLAQGRPLLVLVQEQPERFHYLVLLGWLSGRVVVHDPARRPHRVIEEPAFEAAWAATNYWSLLILPASNPSASLPVEPRVPAPAPQSVDHCSEVVGDAVRAAHEGDLTAAEERLLASTKTCPDSPAPLRELAGVRFLQSRWDEAATLAERAVALDPADSHAWRTLAASRFVHRDLEAALDAWNAVDEPRVDLLRVDGLTRTRYGIVERTLDLQPEAVLTAERLNLARRRLSALPIALTSRVGYRPLPEGLAQVEASLVERPLLFDAPSGLIAATFDAAVERQLAMDVSSPMGGGDLWTVRWRWLEERPLFGLSLGVPRPWQLPGIWELQGFWERQAYGLDAFAEAAEETAGTVIREERRRAALGVSEWISPSLRARATAAVDRWEASGSYLSVGGSLDKRMAGDRIAIEGYGGGWSSLGNHEPFAVAGLRAGWRSSAKSLLSGRGGIEMATASSPLALWPGAGVGHAREPLLRAHPLLEDGIVRGDTLGRTLAHGGLEMQTRFPKSLQIGPTDLRWALFADMGKAWRGLSGSPSPLHGDIGAGLRFQLLGDGRTLRVDAAYGLRDGEKALSIGWQLPWPGWR